MKVAKDNFLVSVDSQFTKLKIGELDFFLDTDYNPKRLATTIGKIIACPVRITDQWINDIELKEGDTIIFNRLVCQNKNKVKENEFYCAYHSIYAKVMDKIECLEDAMFCEPIIEPDTMVGQFEVKGCVSSVCAKVVYLSNKCKEVGIRENDIVYYTKNADYEMEIGGKLFYKMQIRSIIGIERDGELKTFGKKLLVKNITKLGCAGTIEKIYAQSNLQTGVVLESGNTGIEKDTVLTYLNGTASVVKWKDEWYAFINEENIKYIK